MSNKITVKELIELSNSATDAKVLSPFFKEDPQSLPFKTAITIDEDKVDNEGFLGIDWMEWMNTRARRYRLSLYKQRLREHYPYKRRIVSEGDSWFQYPVLLDELIDQCNNYKELNLVYSLGAAGDTMSHMVVQQEYLNAIELEKPQIFMISGGGNDILAPEEMLKSLKPHQNGMNAEDHIIEEVFNQNLGNLIAHYESVFDIIRQRFPSLHILCHGYDYAKPGEGGGWLEGPMETKQIPENQRHDIVKIMIDRFNESLNAKVKEFQSDHFGQIRYIDCRGMVPDNGWRNEIHPKNRYFRKIYHECFKPVIEELVP